MKHETACAVLKCHCTNRIELLKKNPIETMETKLGVEHTTPNLYACILEPKSRIWWEEDKLPIRNLAKQMKTCQRQESMKQKQKCARASEMAHQVKLLVTKPDILSSSPRTYTIEGENWLPHIASNLNSSAVVYTHPHKYIHSSPCSKWM